MAHLKHGSQHAMSQQVIKGAMRALSRWMANTRKVGITGRQAGTGSNAAHNDP